MAQAGSRTNRFCTKERQASVSSYDVRRPLEGRLANRFKVPTKHGAQWMLKLVLGIVGFATRARRSFPSLAAGDSSVRRILVVRVDLLGDVVLSLPAVRALRRAYPQACIDMLVLAGNKALLENDPDISAVYTFDPSVWRRPQTALALRSWRTAWTLIRTLRAQNYDLAISISGDIGSILTRLSGSRRRVGYRGEAYPFFLTDPLPGRRYTKRRHEVQYVLELARAAGGIVQPGDEQLLLYVDAEAARRMKETIEQSRKRLERHGPVVAIHAGARNGSAKRWPVEHVAALGDMLITRLNALVVFTGAPGEKDIVTKVEQRMRERAVNLVGSTTILELVALLAAVDVVITGDSGPMHIATALRTPVVALHGPTDPGISGPVAPGAIVLRQRLWCSPCYDASATAECRFADPICMKSLLPHVVFRAVERQLAQGAQVMHPDLETSDHVHASAYP